MAERPKIQIMEDDTGYMAAVYVDGVKAFLYSPEDPLNPEEVITKLDRAGVFEYQGRNEYPIDEDCDEYDPFPDVI